MSSDYAQSLELLAQVEEQVDGVRIDATKNRINIQRLYAFGQNWDLLRVALTATREVAEKAKAATVPTSFAPYMQRYASAISGNLDDYYKEISVPHADVVQSHQRYLDTLNCHIEAVKLSQKLDMIYVRWVQIQAAADLKEHAKNFHLMVRRLKFCKRRADDASRRAGLLRRKMAQRVREYEYLKREVLKVQRILQAL